MLHHYFCKLVAKFQLTCRNIWVANIWYILGRRYTVFRGIWKLETIKPWVCGLIWLLFHSERGPGGSNDVTVRLVRAQPINHIQQHCRCSVSLKLTIPQRSSCKGGGLPATFSPSPFLRPQSRHLMRNIRSSKWSPSERPTSRQCGKAPIFIDSSRSSAILIVLSYYDKSRIKKKKKRLHTHKALTRHF